MRVVATADFHGRVLPEIPECDLFVYAGDIGGQQFTLGPFARWLSSIPARYKVGIAGNHDHLAEQNAAVMRSLPWTYLFNETIEIEGIRIWGSPYSNRFYEWAFMADEEDLRKLWASIPDGADLVVTHGPPYGACDRVRSNGRDDPHVGSTSLRERLEAVGSVRYAVCGHIHEAYGSGRITRGDGSVVDVFNVSIVNEAYQVVNEPVVWEM